jgi:hypothetical protein
MLKNDRTIVGEYPWRGKCELEEKWGGGLIQDMYVFISVTSVKIIN